MPQECCVLKCFSCETFQAHIVKKAKKWECKICGVKQSLKKTYGTGSGLDCRRQVMKLNELRLKNRNNQNQMISEFLQDVTDDSNENLTKYLDVEKPVISKWTVYLEDDAPVNDGETDLFKEILGKREEGAEKAPGRCYSKNENFSKKPIKSGAKDFRSASSKQQNLYFFHKSEAKTQVTYPVEFKDGSKTCKHAKKTTVEEDKNHFIKEINKSSNIFESNFSDLDDDVLNF